MTHPKQTVGVVIGRFQVPSLHAGHEHLINTALAENNALLIIVGSGRGLSTPRYPLPYLIRKAMLAASYPHAVIVEHFDDPSDERWSAGVDALTKEHFPNHPATLYGSRDSFLPYYHGNLKTKEVVSIECESGSDQRAAIVNDPPESHDFRAGLIYREATRLPIPYQAVDIAVLKGGGRQILLGQKETDGQYWRFIGGFVDPVLDRSLEAAAKREAYEETGGLEVADLRYHGSTIVDDWRYRQGQDRVMTCLFSATYIFGHPVASDDLAALRWFSIEEAKEVLSPIHQPLLSLLLSSAR